MVAGPLGPPKAHLGRLTVLRVSPKCARVDARRTHRAPLARCDLGAGLEPWIRVPGDHPVIDPRLPYVLLVLTLVSGCAARMAEKRKITLEVPEELLERALAASGEGITQTVRQGLQLVAAGRAYEELRRLRGKVKLGLDLEALREDR